MVDDVLTNRTELWYGDLFDLEKYQMTETEKHFRYTAPKEQT